MSNELNTVVSVIPVLCCIGYVMHMHYVHELARITKYIIKIMFKIMKSLLPLSDTSDRLEFCCYLLNFYF